MTGSSRPLLLFDEHRIPPAVRLGVQELLSFIRDRKHESKLPNIGLTDDLEAIQIHPLAEVVLASSLVIYIVGHSYHLNTQPVSGMSKLLTTEAVEWLKSTLIEKLGSRTTKKAVKKPKKSDDEVAAFIEKVVRLPNGSFLNLANNSTLYFFAARIYLANLLFDPAVESSIRLHLEVVSPEISSIDWLFDLRRYLLQPVDIDRFDINRYRDKEHVLLELVNRRFESEALKSVRWLKLKVKVLAENSYGSRSTLSRWLRSPENVAINRLKKTGMVEVNIDHPELKAKLRKGGFQKLLEMYEKIHS